MAKPGFGHSAAQREKAVSKKRDLIARPEDKACIVGQNRRVYAGMDVVSAALERIRWCYDNFDTIVVATSGGKDSVAVTELARMVAHEKNRLPVHLLFVDEEIIFPEIRDILQLYVNDPDFVVWWCNMLTWYRNSCSEEEPDWTPWDPDKRDVWVAQPHPQAIWPIGQGRPPMNLRNAHIQGARSMHPAELAYQTIFIHDLAPDFNAHLLWPRGSKSRGKAKWGNTCQLLGLRTAESMSRLIGLLSRCSFINTRWDKAVATPIYDWRDGDVWWAFEHFDWPLCAVYLKLWRANIHPRNLRLAHPLAPESIRSLPVIEKYWPEFWTAIQKRIRGVSAVAKHEQRLHKAIRHPGETWQDCAMRLLDETGNDADRETMTHHLTKALERHREHSTQLIHETIPCNVCAMDWHTIADIMAKGDRHGRQFRRQSSLLHWYKLSEGSDE